MAMRRHPTRWSTSLLALARPTLSAMSTSTSPLPGPLNATFERLRSNKNAVLVLDGGTGEELFRHGVPDDRKIWSAKALVNPEYHPVLEQVHRSFQKAGSQAITTNSYAAVPSSGFSSDEISKYAALAGKIARESVDGNDSLVFGSLGPLVESYRADRIKKHAEGVADYKNICQALDPYVDAYLAETMSCVDESAQAMQAVAESSSRPMLVAYTLTSEGCFRDGNPVVPGLGKLLDLANEKKVQVLAVLFNCCVPEAITIALKSIHSDIELRSRLSKTGVLLGAYANRLTPVDPNWTMADSAEPQPFRTDLSSEQYWDDFVKVWVSELDVQLVGGCCGITPEHVSYISSHLQTKESTTTK